MPDRERQVARSWEANAAAWAAAVRDGAIESRRVATDAAILDAVAATGARNVLDAGCGEGWLCRRLAASGLSASGFDGSTALIRRARERHPAGSYHVLDYAAFAAEPSRAGSNYDAVVANFALLGERIRAVLEALRLVSSPDGHLLVQTLHPVAVTGASRYEDGWREEKFDGFAGDWTPMPWFFRTLGSWVRELDGAGWRIHEVHEPLHPETGVPLSLIWHARIDSAV